MIAKNELINRVRLAEIKARIAEMEVSEKIEVIEKLREENNILKNKSESMESWLEVVVVAFLLLLAFVLRGIGA